LATATLAAKENALFLGAIKAQGTYLVHDAKEARPAYQNEETDHCHPEPTARVLGQINLRNISLHIHKLYFEI